MRITLLGTGCPSVHPRRYGASQLIEGMGAKVLVDCGNGCTQRLVQAGHSPAAVDALFVTHLHSDHLVDLWQLVVAGWHAGRPHPLRGRWLGRRVPTSMKVPGYRTPPPYHATNVVVGSHSSLQST